MANVNIPDLVALTAPAATDVIEVYDASAAANVRLALSYVALTGTANVFTANQRVNALVGVNYAPTASQQLTVKAGSTSTVALVVDTAASASAKAQEWRYNGTQAAYVTAKSNESGISLTQRNLGNNVRGPYLVAYANSNAGAEGPAAGCLQLRQASNVDRMIWPDAAGNLRINTAAPTGSSGSPTISDTAGTVVGTQTSTLASKNILGDGVSPADALATILATPVKRFKYKSDAYNGSEFHGIIADYSPEFAMDDGRVFNPVSAFGFTVQAVKALTERITALEAK